MVIQWNLSNPTHQGTREMCRTVQDVGILRFILVNRNTLGPLIFVRCHRMSENSGVGLHKFHCTCILPMSRSEFKIFNYLCTKVVSSNLVHGKMYSIQHYVIKFVNDLPQVVGFLWVLRFPPPRYNWHIVESGIKHRKPNQTKPEFKIIYTHVVTYHLKITNTEITNKE